MNVKVNGKVNVNANVKVTVNVEGVMANAKRPEARRSTGGLGQQRRCECGGEDGAPSVHQDGTGERPAPLQHQEAQEGRVWWG